MATRVHLNKKYKFFLKKIKQKNKKKKKKKAARGGRAPPPLAGTGITDSVKMVDGKSTQGVKRNYYIAQGPPMNFLNHKE
jgi:hypothetical protein